MNPRHLQYAPLAAVVLALIAVALLLGKRALTTTETEVIERVADRYVSEMGDSTRRMDCAAVPAASEGLWLVVSCTDLHGVRIDYFVDRFGRVAHAAHAADGAGLLRVPDAPARVG